MHFLPLEYADKLGLLFESCQQLSLLSLQFLVLRNHPIVLFLADSRLAVCTRLHMPLS